MLNKIDQTINILGTRGIPAAHGGFETFAEQFALFMRDNGWRVVVYCQGDEGTNHVQRTQDTWKGIERVFFSTKSKGALSTIEFDLRCTLDVIKRPGVDLVLGYNTAIFSILQRISGRNVIMNMDGIEWKRAKWNSIAKAWFWINEWIGIKFSKIAIADHPEIANHLRKRGGNNITTIAYGYPEPEYFNDEILDIHGLEKGGYFISIARVEPENSILEIVRAFSTGSLPGKLVILGNLSPENNYHNEVRSAASSDVIFPGAIYDKLHLASLRHNATAYIHGHQVGGTNPSLVEALAMGNAVVAHDNKFNRWTAGEGQIYFKDEEDLKTCLSRMSREHDLRKRAEIASKVRYFSDFTPEKIHAKYLEVVNSAAN